MRIDKPTGVQSELTGSFSGSFKGEFTGKFSSTIGTAVSGAFTQDSSSFASRIDDLETFEANIDNTYATDGDVTAVSNRVGTLEGKTLLSSSAQIASDISGSFTQLSSSVASTYLLNTTDTLTGDLTVTGTITAQEFHTEFVSSSIIFSSGSTKFGDTTDDNHEFTGSIKNYGGDGLFLTSTAGDTANIFVSPSTPGLYLDFPSSYFTAFRGSSEFMRINSNGRVGIGTNNPGSLLHLDSTNPVIIIRDSNGADIQQVGYLSFQDSGSVEQAWIGYGSSANTDFTTRNKIGRIRFEVGSSTAMSINTDAKIGIGTTTTSDALLTIKGADNPVGIGDQYGRTGIKFYGSTSGLLQIFNSYNNNTYGHIDFLTGDGTSIAVRVHNNGNVGIGTDAPDGDLQIYSSVTEGSIRIGGGNGAGNSRIFIQSDGNDSYIDSYGDSQYKNLSIQAASLLLNSSVSAGSVGIGTTTPQSLTHIYETGTVGNNYYEGDLQVGGVTASLGAKLQYSAQNSGRVSLVNLNNGGGVASTIDLGFGAMASDGRPTNKAVTVTQGGSVGVGTTAPGSNIDVVSNAGGNGVSIRTRSNNDWGWLIYNSYDNTERLAEIGINRTAASTGNIYFNTADGGSATVKMIIKSDGNVGIGTTLPADKLDIVNGHARISGVGYGLYFDTTGAAASNFIKSINDYETVIANGRGSAGFAVIGNANIRLGFGTAYTGAQSSILIQSSGNVGIGTTSPSGKLHVLGGSGAIAGTGLTYINNTDDAFGLVVNNAGTSAQNDRGVFDARIAGSSVFRINNSGKVGIGTTSPTDPLHIRNTSDISLRLEGTTNWSGIVFQDVNGFDTMYFNGQNRTFSFGGQFSGGSNVAGKQLHVHGAVTIGSNLASTAVSTNGLYVEKSVRSNRVEYNWYKVPNITSSDTYVHIKTDLYMGAGNNYMFIMGGFTFKGYRYATNGYGEGSVMFHNWQGTFYNASVTNRGDWSTFVRSPYASSDGYCVLVIEHNDYNGALIDFYQFYEGYPWRTVTVTNYGTSNNLNGLY